MRHPPPPPMQRHHRQRHPHDYYPAAAAYHHCPPPPPMPPAGSDRSLYTGSGYFSHNLPGMNVGMSRDVHRRSVPHTQLPRTPPAAVLESSSHALRPAREKDGQGPVQAPAPAVGNAVKLQLIPIKPVIRCGLCKLNFTSSESFERHKTKTQHKKSLLMQKFQNTPAKQEVEGNKSSNVGEANKVPCALENKQQTPFLTTEQTTEGGQPDPEEAKRERRRLKRQAAKWRNKDMKTMRYYKPPIEPPKEQPRCCILCNVTYQTKDTFESHLSGKKHVSRLSLCEDEDSVYGLINAYIPPDRLIASQEPVPMFYGLKTRMMLQQEARGQAIMLDYEWRRKDQALTVNGGALDVNMGSEDQSAAVECGTKEEMASATSHKAPFTVPEYDVVLPGLGADRGALENVNIDIEDQNAVEFREKEQTGLASEVAMSHQASFGCSGI